MSAQHQIFMRVDNFKKNILHYNPMEYKEIEITGINHHHHQTPVYQIIMLQR